MELKLRHCCLMYRDMEQLQEAVADPEDHAGMGRGRRGSGMPLIPVPIEGGKMSSKTFEMAVRPNRRLIGTELEFSVAVFFSITFKNIFLVLLAGDDRRHRPLWICH